MIQVVNKETEQLKVFFVLHGEVLTGFKHNFKKQPKVFYKKSCSYKFRNIHRKTPVLESLFNKVSYLQALFNKVLGLQACNFIKGDSNTPTQVFPVNIGKFLRTLILKDICEQLLLNFIAPNGKISGPDTYNPIKPEVGHFCPRQI